MTDLFQEIIPSILLKKKDVLVDEKDYVPFVVNKALSFHYDCIMYANQANMMHGIDNVLQYHFLLHSVRPRKRPYQKWLKKEKIDDLEVVRQTYKLSNEKAEEYLSLLSKDQISALRERLDRGGAKKR